MTAAGVQEGGSPPPVVLTGASGMIGRVIARSFAEAGHPIALIGRRPEPLRALRDQLARRGAQVWACGQARWGETEVRSEAHRIHEALGTVGVLVNGAAVRHKKPIGRLRLAEWEEMLDSSLTATFLWTRELLGPMVAEGWGRVINIAGTAGEQGGVDRSGVAAAKGGVIAFTKSVAAEVQGTGVTVNAVSPGRIVADDERAVDEVVGRSGAAANERPPRVPAGRPADVAAACCFLASPEAGHISGEVLRVNGGAYR